MLKNLALAVLLAIVLPVSWHQKGTQTEGDKQEAQTGKNPSPPADNKAQCAIKEEGTTIECDWPKSVPDSYLKRLFSAENTPNIALFFVGLSAVIAAGFTLRAINRQADMMEKTLILQFRPKIIVRTGEVHTSIMADFNQSPLGNLTYSIANSGGTPAHILTGRLCMTVIDIETAWRTYTGPMEIMQPLTLQPGQSLDRTIELDGRINGTVRQEDEKHRGAPHGGKRMVIFSGSISYRDDVGIERSMGFIRTYDSRIREFRRIRNPDREYSD